MGLRMRKSIKIAPGVKLNVGKSSAGLSVGGKVAGVSVNSRTGVRGRVSAPGTGLSYSEKLSGPGRTEHRRAPQLDTNPLPIEGEILDNDTGAQLAEPGGGGGKRRGCLFWCVAILFWPISLCIWFYKTDRLPLPKAARIGIIAVVWVLLLISGARRPAVAPPPEAPLAAVETAQPTAEPTATPEPTPEVTQTPASDTGIMPQGKITAEMDTPTYWTENGSSYHFSQKCQSLSRAKNIQSGTLQDAINAGKTDPCDLCACG